MKRALFGPGRRPAAPKVTGAPRAPRIVSPTGNVAQAQFQQQGPQPRPGINTGLVDAGLA